MDSVFARLLLNGFPDHQVLAQHPEQAGFTLSRLTIDRTHRLRVLIERHLDCRQDFLEAYVEYKKASTLGTSALLPFTSTRRALQRGGVTYLASSR